MLVHVELSYVFSRTCSCNKYHTRFWIYENLYWSSFLHCRRFLFNCAFFFRELLRLYSCYKGYNLYITIIMLFLLSIVWGFESTIYQYRKFVSSLSVLFPISKLHATHHMEYIAISELICFNVQYNKSIAT